MSSMTSPTGKVLMMESRRKMPNQEEFGEWIEQDVPDWDCLQSRVAQVLKCYTGVLTVAYGEDAPDFQNLITEYRKVGDWNA